MPAKTIYLHLGLAKTGSTALQRTIAGGHQRLAAEGLHSWSVAPNHGPPLARMLGVKGVGVLPELASYQYQSPEALQRSLLQEIAAADDAFMLSGEQIPGFGRPALLALKDFLESTGAELRAFAYVREPRAWMTSQVQQLVKAAGRTMEEATAEVGGWFGRVIPPLLDTFGGRLSLRFYGTYATPNALLEDFLGALGRDPALAGEFDMGWENTSLSHRGVVLLEAMNHLARSEGRPGPNWLPVAESVRVNMRGPGFRLPASALDAIIDSNADAIALASKHAGVDLASMAGPEGDADIAWRPDDDLVRTMYAVTTELAQTKARMSYGRGRTLLAAGDEPKARRAFVNALTHVADMPEAKAVLDRLQARDARRAELAAKRRARQAEHEEKRGAAAENRPVGRAGQTGTATAPRVPTAVELEEIAQLGHRDFVGGMWEEIGQLQFDFLLAEGLEPHHVLLDIGCGNLRAGVHLIRYLEPGHYLGLDQHRELIDRGITQELGEALAGGKIPEFVVSSDFEFEQFSRVPHAAIAQSLFTHLTADDISLCLNRLRSFVGDGCRLYATFFEAREPVDNPPLSGSRIMFHHTRAELEELGRANDWEPRYLGAWNHPRGQMMMRFDAA
jgi:hypothetical protein